MTDPSHNQVSDNPVPAATYPSQAESGLLWTHAVLFSIGLVVIGMSFAMRSEGQRSVFLPGANYSLPELCAAKRLFNLPCPGCGLTRSFISISHGQLQRAWSFNPAGFLLYPFVFAQIPWNAMQFWLIRKRGYGVQLPYIHFIPIALAIVLLVCWLVSVPQLF